MPKMTGHCNDPASANAKSKQEDKATQQTVVLESSRDEERRRLQQVENDRIQDSDAGVGFTSLSSGQTLRVSVANAAGQNTAPVTVNFDIYSLGGPDTAPGCSPGAGEGPRSRRIWARARNWSDVMSPSRQ